MKNKILTALLAASIAFALWAYVITVERPESENTYYNVPVVFEGEMVLMDRGLMVTSDTQMTVTVKLSGKRSDLNKLKSSDIAAVVDLSRITEAGTEPTPYDISIPGDSSIKVANRYPESLSLTVIEWASKPISVELDFEGQAHPDYYADTLNAKLEHESVTVTGPKEIIGQIEKAKITLDLKDRTESIDENRRYALCDKDGNPIEDVSSVTTDRGEIRATVSILPKKEVKLTYTVVEGGGLTAEDVKITADYETAWVSGRAAVLENLDSIHLGTVDLGALTESTEQVMPINLPEGVSNREAYTVVHLTIELPELETREYTINQIRTENTPTGYTAKIDGESLLVKIRGRKPILNQLKPEHISAVVDLTGQKAGTVRLPVKIMIVGFETVENLGAVEEYWVNVTLSENRPNPLTFAVA